MSVEQDLQDFILTKYKSVNQFADEAGVAYTTLKGGLSRGIMGMSVQNVIKICNTLNIDINKLAEGKIETAKKNIPLDIDEFNLINQYRAVDSFGKQLIVDVAKHEYNRCQEQQEETVKVYRVAQSDDDHPAEIKEMKRSELNQLHSLPMTDEDL